MRMWGYRLAFISMQKSAVEIEKRSGFFKEVILTTKDPEEFIQYIERKSDAIHHLHHDNDGKIYI